jgi:isopenicillin N synthase-like dioxygenase
MPSALNIPLLDLNDFINGSNQSKVEFVEKLGKAYEQIGFVAIKNHGLSDEMVEKIYLETKNFFALPMEIKKKI